MITVKVISREVSDPTAWAKFYFENCLQACGVRVDHVRWTSLGDEYSAAKVVATLRSPPLSEIAKLDSGKSVITRG